MTSTSVPRVCGFHIYILGLCKEKEICAAFSLIIQANLGTKQMRSKTKQLKAKAY